MAVSASRARARAVGIAPGVFEPGTHNAITDVGGVRVGHVTLVEGESIRTGVTVVLPHGGNLYREPVRAATFAANGYGKIVGTTQVAEIGTIETPVALTGTLSIFRVADALVTYTLSQRGNEDVRSVNPLAGETNDGWLSDIRARPVNEAHVLRAIAAASDGAVEGGCVGAGTGTVCLGWKGGIGTSSRVTAGGAVGVIVQTNFAGRLRACPGPATDAGAGSVILVVATDAALDARQLGRLARRATYALARVGANYSGRSGDYAIAFSTAREGSVDDATLDPLFEATLDCIEEAVLDSMCLAATTAGMHGRVVEAIPLDRIAR